MRHHEGLERDGNARVVATFSHARAGTSLAMARRMRLLFARFLCLVFAGGSLCAIATCSRRELPPAQAPEVRPAGPAHATPPKLPISARPDEKKPEWPLDAQPASISPKKPPLDAGVDGGVQMPPVPDAQIPGLRDAGLPLTQPATP